jgi:hypothetical protein
MALLQLHQARYRYRTQGPGRERLSAPAAPAVALAPCTHVELSTTLSGRIAISIRRRRPPRLSAVTGWRSAGAEAM